MRHPAFLFVLAFGSSCRGQDFLRSLGRRLQKKGDGPLERILWLTLSDEETSFAIDSRHKTDPEERNVFVRGAAPTTSPVSPIENLSPAPTNAPTKLVSDGTSVEPSMLPSETPSMVPSVDTPVEPSPTASPAPLSPVTESPTRSEGPFDEFLSETLTDDGSLQVPGTPQYQAIATLGATNPDLDPADSSDQIEITLRYALNTLYFSTEGANWKDNSLWTTANHPCGSETTETWFGVKCDDSLESVESISMEGNNLLGQLPSEIRGLTSLRELSS